MKKLFNIILITCLSTLLFSCKNGVIYEKNLEIEEGIWDMNNILEFVPKIDSINKPYDIFINIRHSDYYPSQNLWLFIETISPNNLTQVDTFECVLAEIDGKWLGSGMGDIWDIEIPYKQNIAFPVSGEYKIKIQQGTRSEKLPLIMEIGVKIKETKIDK